MTSPIVASFRWSKEEFMRAQLLAMRSSRQARLIHRVCAFIGAIILLSGVFGLYKHTTDWPGLLITFFFGAFFFSIPLFTRRAIQKAYAQKPDRDMEVTWEISDDGIRSKTELALSENKWAFFQKAVRSRDGFLLYPTPRIFHWIPMHAFREGDAERFAELLKEKVKDYHQSA